MVNQPDFADETVRETDLAHWLHWKIIRYFFSTLNWY